MMVYNCGPGMQNDAVSTTREDSALTLFENVSEKDFDDRLGNLLEQGFEVDFSNRMGANRYASLWKGDQRYYLYYTAPLRQMRLIEDRSTNVRLSKLDDAMGRGTTEFYAYALDYTHGEGQTNPDDYWRIDCGALLVVKLADDSLFLIDSGHERQSSPAAQAGLMAFLRRITGAPEKEKIRIRAWFFTHAHGDHVYLAHQLAEHFHDQLDVGCLLHNFPSYHVMKEGYDEGTFLLRESMSRYYPNCKFAKLHTGEQFTLQGVEIAVLHTHEDGSNACGGSDIRDFNDTSTVLTLEFDGKRFLLLGDGAGFVQENLPKMYPPDVLKSDFVQAGHHGYNDLTALYAAIGAPIVLYSNSEENAGENSGNREKFLGAMAVAKDCKAIFSDPDTVKIWVEDGEIRYAAVREGKMM